MKKRLGALLFLPLCVVFLLVCIACTANAESGKNKELTFSTFEQLRAFAADSYEELTWVKYTGEKPLVIAEDLVLPDHLCLDVTGARLAIAADVEFISAAHDFSNRISGGIIHVNGTLTCDYLDVTDALIINGTVNNNNVIYLNSTTGVTGAEKIVPAQDWSMVSVWYDIADPAQLQDAVSDAANAADPTWRYFLNLVGNEILIDESFTIPENCELYIDQTEGSAAVTVAEGCVLELDCRTWLYTPLAVEGTLINHGSLNISYGDGGSLSLPKGGLYLGEGPITVYSDAADELSDIMPGFDLDDFEIATCEEPLFSRQLQSACPHSMEDFVPTVTAPSCGSGGYTTYACQKCGSSYIREETPPTGLHVYADAYDTDCDICGAARDIQNRTAPLYRLYNVYTLEHLFTANEQERDSLLDAGWTLDGIAWCVPDSGEKVYRLYNPYDDGHFYTVSTEEIDTLLPLGWQLDGIMCYSASAETGEPIYRLFNPYETKNYHLYTVSTEECEMLVPLGWILEGVAWYGMLE